MNIFTEENLNQFMKFQNLIKEKAENLLKEIEDITPIENNFYLTFYKIEDGLIEYYGSCCGDNITYSLPLSLFYDEDFKKEYIEYLKRNK